MTAIEKRIRAYADALPEHDRVAYLERVMIRGDGQYTEEGHEEGKKEVARLAKHEASRPV